MMTKLGHDNQTWPLREPARGLENPSQAATLPVRHGTSMAWIVRGAPCRAASSPAGPPLAAHRRAPSLRPFRTACAHLSAANGIVSGPETDESPPRSATFVRWKSRHWVLRAALAGRCICSDGYREGTKSIRRCVYRRELDLDTLVCTRARTSRLRLQSRLLCPACGSHNITAVFEPPSSGQVQRRYLKLTSAASTRSPNAVPAAI